MKRDLSTKPYRLVMLTVVCFLILPLTVLASDTTINNIREGLHPDYTRIVFDCSGQPPERIGPAQTGFISLRYAGLAVTPALDQISGALRGAVDRIELLETEDRAGNPVVVQDPGCPRQANDAAAGYELRQGLPACTGHLFRTRGVKSACRGTRSRTVAAALPPPVPQPASGRITFPRSRSSRWAGGGGRN